MVVDASALIAILRSEPEQDAYSLALSRAPTRRISPVNWHEVAVVMERTNDFQIFESVLVRLRVSVASIDEAQARLAHLAWRRFGKGRHPARLNLGDCFAYALAKQTGEPLLFKGRDFGLTDVKAAV